MGDERLRDRELEHARRNQQQREQNEERRRRESISREPQPSKDDETM